MTPDDLRGLHFPELSCDWFDGILEPVQLSSSNTLFQGELSAWCKAAAMIVNKGVSAPTPSLMSAGPALSLK